MTIATTAQDIADRQTTHLERQKALINDEIRQLKRDRNDMAPISRLPTELPRLPGPRRTRRDKPPGEQPYSVPHLSPLEDYGIFRPKDNHPGSDEHKCRTAGVRAEKFQVSTAFRIEFMISGMPFQRPDQQIRTINTVKRLSRILQDERDRVESLSIYSDGKYLEKMFAGVTGRLGRLDPFRVQIYDRHDGYKVQLDDLLEFESPNLRILDLKGGCLISSTCSILRSPHLSENTTIHPIGSQWCAGRPVDLLQNIPTSNLSRITLSFILTAPHTYETMEQLLESNTPPISMPQLEYPDLSGTWGWDPAPNRRVGRHSRP